MNSRIKISQIIKQLRIEKNITQKELAEKTGISLSAIIAYENQKREPNSKAMAKLETFFRVSGSYLRGENDDPDVKMIWDSIEIMDEIDQQFPSVLNDIFSHSIECDQKNKKMVFDILCELKHILKINNSHHKDLTLDALQSNIYALTKFIDIYRYSASNEDFQVGRLYKIKEDTTNTISHTLDKLIKEL